MADPLKTLSGLISVGTGVSSLLSNKSRDQYRYQLSLNRQQQQFARENRAAELRNQYQYQYNLPLLNKAGLQAAGFSVAGVEDGNVSAVNTPGTASPSAGSAPTGAADVQAQLGVANLLQQLSLVQAQTEKTKQEAEGQRIQNDINSKSADWTVMLNESKARSSKIQAIVDEKYGDRKEHAATVTAEIEAQLKQYDFETGTQLTNLQIDAARKNLDILDIQADNLKKAGAISDITYQKIKQDIAESRARVSNLDADTEGKRIDNKFNRDSFDTRLQSLQHKEVRALLDSYPKTIREAAYSILLNPELYPYVTSKMSKEEIEEMRELNKNLLDLDAGLRIIFRE